MAKLILMVIRPLVGRHTLVLGAYAVLAAPPGAFAASIDTTTGPSSYLASLSSLGGAWGQTFTVSDSDPILETFSLFLDGVEPASPNPSPMNLRGFVAEWNTLLSKPENIVFESSVLTASPEGLQEFVFSPHVQLDAGRYVAFLSTFNLPAQLPIAFDVKVTTTDILRGESFVTTRSDGSWYTPTGYVTEMWFKAEFAEATPVPEPPTFLLLLFAVVGVAAAARPRTGTRY